MAHLHRSGGDVETLMVNRLQAGGSYSSQLIATLDQYTADDIVVGGTATAPTAWVAERCYTTVTWCDTGNKIKRISKVGSTWTVYTYSLWANADPRGITLGPEPGSPSVQIPWFSEAGLGQIGYIYQSGNGVVHECTLSGTITCT
jgi:hypothetical protein